MVKEVEKNVQEKESSSRKYFREFGSRPSFIEKDFSLIKNKLIQPLLFATEKVVEYYFPEE